MYSGFIVQIDNLTKHPNADRLQMTNIFENNVIVDLKTQIGDIGVYFPVDGQLNEQFCDANHLCRKKADGTPDTGYLNRDKRKVSAIMLRGEKSEGLFLPIKCFDYLGVTFEEDTVGLPVTTIRGQEICRKYIPKRNKEKSISSSKNKKIFIQKEKIAPLFQEHKDTEQLAYNLNAFKPGDLIEITCKMHGTSQRTGYLPVLVGYDVNKIDNYFLNKYLKNPNAAGRFTQVRARKILEKAKPIYDWKYISGTRRVVLDDWNGGFYGSNQFRKQHADFFEGKLHKGETVYYEVVGFTDSGTPIMPAASNKSLGKDFMRQYGETTIFSYGCENMKSDFYVYRMTMTNEDGDVIEYTPDYMRYRCEQMRAKTVPVFWRGFLDEPDDWAQEEYNAGEVVEQLAKEYYDGVDPIGKTHIREGVVVRIINRPQFTAYKHKNFNFKVLSGIAIDTLENSKDVNEITDDVISEM